MLAANNGRVDLCELLLDAGAAAGAVDGEGCTALHAACIDLPLAKERLDEGIACDPARVVALLLSRAGDGSQALVGAMTNGGLTARGYCEKHRADAPEVASACERLLAETA